MGTSQDCSIMLKKETTYKTPVTVDRSFEFFEESLDWTKNVVQGKGLRAGSISPRTTRRVIPTQEGSGDFSLECISRGMGYLWELALGSGASTLVSGSTYQQVFTGGTSYYAPSATIQKQVVRQGGTVDAYTFAGCSVKDWEFAFPNGDIATLKLGWDMATVTTATAAATNAYPASTANLFHFANGTIASGTLTAPTSTALASGTTTLANVRAGTISCNNNLTTDKFNFDGTGRKSTGASYGIREISGTLEIEYDATTMRDAYLNDTAQMLIVNFSAGALSSGNETLQVVLPDFRLDTGGIPMANGNDTIRQTVNFTAGDNQSAAQPFWVVTRTADTAL